MFEEFKKRDLKLALATSRLSSIEQLKKDIAHTELLPYFDSVRTRTEESISWTDKTGHLKSICEELGISPSDSMMCGDIPSDIESAHKVGFRLSTAVLSGGIDEEVLAEKQPTYIFPNISKILGLF